MTSLGTVLITGGSRGIGAATVRATAQAGYDVCFTYASRHDAANRLVAEVLETGRSGCCIQADSGHPQAAERILGEIPSEFLPLVGLVNNAGITGPLGSFLETTPATMQAVFAVNVMGTMLLSQGVVKHWREQSRGGSIINISSIAAVLGAPGEYVHYAASKAAVEGFTIGLAREIAQFDIRVNAVSPGTALTEIHATAGEPGRPERVAARIPMRRAAKPEEIAEAVLWLLSERSSYVTGTVLKVAGGL